MFGLAGESFLYGLFAIILCAVIVGFSLIEKNKCEKFFEKNSNNKGI